MRVVQQAKDKARFLGSGRAPLEVPLEIYHCLPQIFSQFLLQFFQTSKVMKTESDVEFFRSIAVNNLPF